MRYFILKKTHLAAIFAAIAIAISLSAFGAAKLVTQTAAELKQLPIYSVETENKEKLLSIGINCAWENSDIPDILNSLDQLQVKATFFLVGDWCDRYPDSVKEIFDRGHELGNHSDRHKDMPSLSESEIIQEIENCSKKIESITGKKPELFRPPSGAYNNTVISAARSLGYYPIQWSLDSVDWKQKTTEEMKARILPKLTYGDILLFHNDTKYTSKALPEIIKEIQNKGYRFVPVGELIHKGKYTVDVQGRQHPAK